MNITIVSPVLTSVGSADDGDPATGAACNYSGAGNGRCNDAFSRSSANPATSTSITASAQAMIGPAPVRTAMANAKGEANSSVQITYSFWERILLFFGFAQQLSAEVDFFAFALVRNGPNQATFAVFLLGGPPGSSNPIPVYQGSYNFDQTAADPNTLDVKKNGAASGLRVTSLTQGCIGIRTSALPLISSLAAMT